MEDKLETTSPVLAPSPFLTILDSREAKVSNTNDSMMFGLPTKDRHRGFEANRFGGQPKERTEVYVGFEGTGEDKMVLRTEKNKQKEKL